MPISLPLIAVALLLVGMGAAAATFITSEFLLRSRMRKDVLFLNLFLTLLFGLWVVVGHTESYLGYLRTVGEAFGLTFAAFVFAHGLLGSAIAISITAAVGPVKTR